MKKNIILIFIIINLISCNEDFSDISVKKELQDPSFELTEINNISSVNLKDITPSFISNSNILKKANTSPVNISLPSTINKFGSTYITKTTTWNLETQSGFLYDGYADEFTMTPSWLGNLSTFHLGSIIQGNSLSNLSFNSVSNRLYDIQPISVSVSFPGKKVYGEYIPDVMATSEFFSKLMIDNGLNNNHKSEFSYNMIAYNYYDELKLLFSSNVDVKALFFRSLKDYNSITDRISKKSGIAVSFTQKNFL